MPNLKHLIQIICSIPPGYCHGKDKQKSFVLPNSDMGLISLVGQKNLGVASLYLLLLSKMANPMDPSEVDYSLDYNDKISVAEVSMSQEDELAIKKTLKNVWKTSSTSNGGYEVKWHVISVPSISNYYPVIVGITNSSGQHHIYIKVRTFIEVLRGYPFQVQKNFSQLATQINLPFFINVLQAGQHAELHETQTSTRGQRKIIGNTRTMLCFFSP